MTPFHLAFPVTNLEDARIFYTEVLGCKVGRSAAQWIDFDFWGHQISAHLVTEKNGPSVANRVDGKSVPVRHFGLILEWEQWHKMADRLKSANVKFVIEPYIRFKGLVGEQATMFIMDPSGNVLEFKSFKDFSQIFADK